MGFAHEDRDVSVAENVEVVVGAIALCPNHVGGFVELDEPKAFVDRE